MTPSQQMPDPALDDQRRAEALGGRAGRGGAAMAGQVADAPADNWVDRRAPAWSRPWLRLSRADRPIGTWLLLIPCWWSLALAAASDAPRAFDLWIALGCGLGAFLMRGAGCSWNDITDRHIDAQVARTRSRPIPSGQVSAWGAAVWMGLQMALAALILLSFNATSIALGLLALLPVAVYPFAKRFTWWPQAFLGIAFNWGALLGWAAHRGDLTAAPIALYLSGIAWTLFYDTIYAHQDREDDALIGVKSTARLFGDNSKRWLALFALIAPLLMALAVWLALPAGSAARMIGLGAPLVLALHLAWQLWRLDIDDGALCLRLFRSNRDAGLLAGLFLAGAALV